MFSFRSFGEPLKARLDDQGTEFEMQSFHEGHTLRELTNGELSLAGGAGLDLGGLLGGVASLVGGLVGTATGLVSSLLGTVTGLLGGVLGGLGGL